MLRILSREFRADEDLLDPADPAEGHVPVELVENPRVRQDAGFCWSSATALAAHELVTGEVVPGTVALARGEELRERGAARGHARCEHRRRIAARLVVVSSAARAHDVLPPADHPLLKTDV